MINGFNAAPSASAALKRGKGVTAADVLREILDKYINNQKGDNN